MPPQRWANEAQLEWLLGKLPAFIKARQERTKSDFLTTTYEAWFLAFPGDTYEGPLHEKKKKAPAPELMPAPEEAPDDADPVDEETEEGKRLQARKDQLFNWFKNNGGPNVPKKSMDPVKATASKGKTRLQQDTEIFQKIYYQDMVKPEVDKALHDQKESGDKEARLKIIRAKTKLAWDAAPEDVRLNVANEKKARKKKREEEQASGTTDARTEAQIQKSIDQIAPFLQPYLNDLSANTGFDFFVLGAGPEPRAGNLVQCYSLHTGRTEDGKSFASANPRFGLDIAQPFVRFVQSLPKNRKPTTPVATVGAADGLALDDPSLVAFSRSASPLPSVVLNPSVVLDPDIPVVPPPASPLRIATATKSTAPRRPLITEYEQDRLDRIASNRMRLNSLLGDSTILGEPLFSRPSTKVRRPRKKPEKGTAPVRRSRRGAAEPSEDIENNTADGDAEPRANEVDGSEEEKGEDGGKESDDSDQFDTRDDDEGPTYDVDPFQNSADPGTSDDAEMKTVDPVETAHDNMDSGTNDDATTKTVDPVEIVHDNADSGTNDDVTTKTVNPVEIVHDNTDPGANDHPPINAVDSFQAAEDDERDADPDADKEDDDTCPDIAARLSFVPAVFSDSISPASPATSTVDSLPLLASTSAAVTPAILHPLPLSIVQGPSAAVSDAPTDTIVNPATPKPGPSKVVVQRRPLVAAPRFINTRKSASAAAAAAAVPVMTTRKRARNDSLVEGREKRSELCAIARLFS
ncbi:hypothetical protein BD410DRAFT_804351 [Rickenella mellea]|uniref:Uncharacterized protein n=1 Tax=Rickenella mellea TaxID=50990 RepID=A0A4Y7Q2C8_9AGAM|nr:hypothetical protein BD410DRAFT_804351 [Rickenella mellea]